MSLELRCATGLARLWHAEGRTTRARELLAPVYGRFTEGFGTADLRAAKTLLSTFGYLLIDGPLGGLPPARLFWMGELGVILQSDRNASGV